MNAIRLILIIVLSLPTLALAAPKSPSDENRMKRGLKPEQLQTIQAIGRAVLAGKHSQRQDPELKQLRQRVRELRKAVKELHHLNFMVEQESPIMDSRDLTARNNQPRRKARLRLKPKAAKEKMAASLSKLRSHRKAMKAKRKGAAVSRQTSLVENAMAKCNELEAEVQQVLESAPSEQAVKLNGLLNHMAPGNLVEMSELPNDTPTMLTITRHRK